MYQFCCNGEVLGSGPTRRKAVLASTNCGLMSIGACMLVEENTTEQTPPHRLIEVYAMARTVDRNVAPAKVPEYSFQEVK